MPADPLPASVAPLPPLNAAVLLRALVRRPERRTGAPTPRTLFVLDRIDAASVRRYRDALGFDGAAIPLTWWYLPAQRAQVATLLDPAFPFRLAGSVHTANALELLGVPDPDAPLTLATHVAVRPPAENGAVIADVETTGGQHGAPLFACRSSYLVVRGTRREGVRRAPASPPGPAVADWRPGPADGRRYARLSGDWNPIHLWAWSARLMGMRRPVIHGMHTLARACAALERAAGRPVAALEGRFTAPAPLGATLALHADPDAGRFAVLGGDRPVAAGSFRFG